MTSRKNQQAARQYMREHDVPYMEALRRVTNPRVPEDFSSQSVASVIDVPPLDKPLTLGFLPPLEPEPAPHRLSLVDRLKGRRPEPDTVPVEAPTPFLVDRGRATPAYITVYGPVGAGKTTFLRSLLEQYRGHASYAIHGGDLVKGEGHRSALGVEPWEGLIDVNLQPGSRIPEPPSVGELPIGSLVVLDLSNIKNALRAEFSVHGVQERAKLRKWFAFEASLGQWARWRDVAVASSVYAESTPDETALPLSVASSPLGMESIKVRLDRRTAERGGHPRASSGAWVYEAFDPASTTDPTPFLLTEEEASRLYIPRVITEEEEEQERWKSAVALERFLALRR